MHKRKFSIFFFTYKPGLALTGIRTIQLCFQQVKLAWARVPKKTSTWSAVNFKKHATLLSSKHEATFWSRDTGQRISCDDSCQLNIIGLLKVAP